MASGHWAEGFKVALGGNPVFLLCSLLHAVDSRDLGPQVLGFLCTEASPQASYLFSFRDLNVTVSFASKRNTKVITIHVNCVVFAYLGNYDRFAVCVCVCVCVLKL